MLLLFTLTVLACAQAGPITIVSSINKNQGEKKNADIFDASHRNGVSSFEEDNGFNRGNEVKFVKGHDSGLSNEEISDHKDHQKEGNFASDQFHKNAGVGSSEFGNNKGHRKGSHKSGFHKTYHKDESGSNSSFYDDNDDRGDEAVYQQKKGAYGDYSNQRRNGGDRDSNHYALDKGKHSKYDHGGNYERDNGHQGQYNQRKYLDNRENGARNNALQQFGGGGDYYQEEYRDRPYYNRNYYPEDYYYDAPVRETLPQRTITVYEDPRYLNRRSYDLEPEYDNEDVRLEFRRPSIYNSREYDRYY